MKGYKSKIMELRKCKLLKYFNNLNTTKSKKTSVLTTKYYEYTS